MRIRIGVLICALASAGACNEPPSSLHGRWNRDGKREVLNFFAEGAQGGFELRDGEGEVSVKGRYEFSGGSVMKLRYRKRSAGDNYKFTYEYSLDMGVILSRESLSLSGGGPLAGSYTRAGN